MQTPKRKKETYRRPQADPHISQKKYDALKKKLNILKNIKQPREVREVKRLALEGDFSENAGYQLAKSRLRGLNRQISEIENELKFAEIISDNLNNKKIQLGNLITIQNAQGQEYSYRLLGSTETNPEFGIISSNSPLGSALLNRQLGDSIEVKLKTKIISYKIIKIA